MRVLITGSREWQDSVRVWAELDRVARDLIMWDLIDPPDRGRVLTVVHGDCRMGADRHAREWCEEIGPHVAGRGVNFYEERHPANWSIGKQAGFARNAEMVNLGADLCLSFMRPCTKGRSCSMPYPHGSHGAAHTTGLARAAGIEVREYREGW